jgi:Uma2 family endonuclease
MSETTPIDILRAAITGNVYKALRDHAESYDLGYVFPHGLFYVLWKDAAEVRQARTPDVSFVRKARVHDKLDFTLPYPGAPDLAVELVTITETNIFTLEKVRDYLAAGTEQVWMIYTQPMNEIHVFHRSEPRSIRVFSRGDYLDGGDLLPHLRLSIGEIFRFP